ncbi:hypothetical protein GCM10017786_28680 [Amycolatopsis deserti]|uniref:Uncharacterized protein n=1 Tax=Amycolatopsis deserti TaxID=185696 RepID=A0ABQ3IZJ6_9PSEU|nr:DUF5360 family protein [Amycolatopsis deserti]GHE94061.1 hypothetical protein GCM10017786_28680 [Amycolatopsis deserti]
MKTRKVFLVITDLGLVVYWTLTACGIISVGEGEWLKAWNWSFFPLDLLAIIAGLTWSLLPKQHKWATPTYATALAFTHAAGLMAISFFVLYATWDASWWLVNLWLVLMPLGLAIASMRKRAGQPTTA